MKCLSVQQPWAALICNGTKDVENRSWATPYRGRILIHAGKSREWFYGDVDYLTDRGVPLPSRYDFGAVIGAVTIINCTSTRSSRWHENGQVGWYLSDPVLFATSVPWRGQLGVFDVPDNYAEIAARRLAQEMLPLTEATR